MKGNSPKIALCCACLGCQLATLPTLFIVTLSGLCVRSLVKLGDVKGKTPKRVVELTSFQGLLSLRMRLSD